MKRIIHIIIYLTALFALASCGKENAETPSQNSTYKLDTVRETNVSLLSDNSYLLTATMSGRGFIVTFSIGSEKLELSPGTYIIKESVNAKGGCSVSLNDGRSNLPITSGTIKISNAGEGYKIEMDIKSLYEYEFIYEGPLAFSLEFVPSSNTLFVLEGALTTYNSNWQPVTVNGVSKYTVTVLDQDSNTLAAIDFISEPGRTLAELAGTYNVKSSSTQAGTILAGAITWGSGSGSNYIDKTGNTLYITGGQIRLSVITGIDGLNYYSLTGSGLSTTSTTGSNNSGTIDLQYVKEQKLLGTIERDHSIASTYKGRTMKYSVYLPGGYDGNKEFPVLYLLHGYGDDQNSWLDKGFLAKYADAYERNGGREMIIVTPDGLTDFYLGAFEEYFFKELVPEIESKYKVIADAEHRTVAGLSMGGYGSIYYWSKYPEMFCYAYPMSPAVDVNGTAEILVGKDKGNLPGLTIETGIQDYTTTLASVTEFHNYLVKEGIDHEFITRDGTHDWKFWQECLPKVLKKCGEAYKD